MSESLKQKTVNGVFWSSIERFSGQGVSFVLGLVIARLLSPSDYGLVAMLSVFFSFCVVFVDSGFSTALIRKVNRTESDNSTVFYFNIAIGFTVSLILFILSPQIAHFYDSPQLVPIARVLCITILLGSFGSVQQVLLTSRIDFKTQAKISLPTVIISSVLGLWGAYSGLGVWALVIQMMTGSLLRPVLLWIFVKWRPTMPFSKESFKELFEFGSKLLASRIIDNIYGNIYTLVIGKVFSSSYLGNYSRANSIAQFPSSNITDIILRVTFPVLSHLQDENERLVLNYRKLLRMSAFIIFPSMVGLSAVSKPLIITLLTDKWSDSVIYMQIICFALMWYPIHSLNLNLLQIKGRSDLFLRVEIANKIIGFLILCVTIPMGLVAMCYGQVAASIISLIINTYYTGKLINIGFFKQVHDLLPALVASLTMGIIVFLSAPLISSTLGQLLFGIAIGGLIYITIAIAFRFPEIGYIKELVFNKNNTNR